jgi:lysyl-tRNA synthetase class 2
MPVAQSSHLQAYEYDPASQTLTVQFTNGAVYTYAGVPETEYHNFAQSAGSGAYFHAKIRGQYRTTQLVGSMRNRSRR